MSRKIEDQWIGIQAKKNQVEEQGEKEERTATGQKVDKGVLMHCWGSGSIYLNCFFPASVIHVKNIVNFTS